jgi:hypothetical protein
MLLNITKKTKEIKMTKLEEYNSKKAALQSQLDEINREIILNEQSIKQQEELFQQQFGTIDLEELKKISNQYNESIAAKEAELAELEANI